MTLGSIFISYAHEDLGYARRLAAFLTRTGADVWMDDEIPTGERWESVLREQIKTCASLLVVMSPAAARSDWVAREVGYARHLGKQILPLLLRGPVMGGLEDVQFEDVTDGTMPGPAFVERLRGLAPRRSVTRHLIGLVPEAADCFQQRDVASQLDQALAVSGTAILTGSRAQILSGLGGVGKTQLAAAVARAARDSGDLHLLLWLSAASAEAIVTGYARAAAQVTGVDPGDPPAAAAALLEWLGKSTSRWLIILDDLTDPRDADGWWPPRTPTGRVVVTTRRRDAALATHGALVEVGPFSPAEAHAYLVAKFADQPERLVDADNLAQDLGHLPVALAQAAAYILDRNLTCASYRTRFADRRRTMAELLPDTLPDDYTRPVTVTLSLSVDVANQLEPVGLAKPLMAIFAVLDPSGAPHGLLTCGAVLDYLTRYRDPKAGTGLVNRERVQDALTCLVRLNLADVSAEGPLHRVSVHGLVQRAVRDQVSAEMLEAAVETAAKSLLELWSRAQQDAGVAQTLRANAEALRSHGEERLWQSGAHDLLLRVGQSLGETGLVAAAVDYLQCLSIEGHERLGADHPDTLAIRYHLAFWQGEAGNAAGAATAFEALLADQLRVLGPDHPDTLRTRGDLASWWGDAGNAARAAAAFEALLVDQLRVLGPDDPDTLTTRHELAYWRGDAGDVAGAAAAFESLLTDRLRVLGADHPVTLITRNNLAFWRGEAGDVAGAVTELDRLLTDRLRVLGPDHPDTLTTRHNLAGWRGRAGDAAGAAAAFESLLPDRLRVMGADHPDTLRTRNNLAHWWGVAGEAVRAVTEFEALLADQSRVLGHNHPATLDTRHELARWRGEAGGVIRAVAEFEALLADQSRVMGHNHPATLDTRHELARWRGEAGDVIRAVAEFEALLADQLRVLGPSHPATVLTQERLASWQGRSHRE
jgi:hypothetical protein